MSFLKDYEPVEDRLRRFWEENGQGRVSTELVYRDERQYVIRAEIYTDREDQRPVATGYAEELISSKGVNSTNALENAETSAIGRALANLNYAPKGSRPSREEMTKANGQQPASPADNARTAVRTYCSVVGQDLAEVANVYQATHEVSLKEDGDPARIFDFLHGLMGKPVAPIEEAA